MEKAGRMPALQTSRGFNLVFANGIKSGTQVSDDSLKTQHGTTTFDRIHAVMLLQADGRTNTLRTLLNAKQERIPDFFKTCKCPFCIVS